MSRYYIYDSMTDQVAEFGKMAYIKGIAQGLGSRTKDLGKKVGKQASLRGKQALGLATSAPGLAVLGTGAVGAAGYGGYAMKKRADKKNQEKQEKRSIKGRIKSLLGK